MSFPNTSQPKLSAIARAVALTLATAAIGTAVAQTATDKKDDQAPRAKEDAVRVGTITVVGQGDKLGAGQILNEDAVKGRSTVTKEDVAVSNGLFSVDLDFGAAAIIVVHNHPSGDPTPSPEDVRVTEMIREAAEKLDITVLDHMIFGRNRYVSLKEKGLGFP